jgi:hypothetical protein
MEVINSVFKLVAGILLRIGRITGLTYNEINILVYYFLVPFSWLLLLDIIFGFHYLKIVFAVYCLVFAIICRNFRRYADCLFDKSVSFLNYFNKFGSNYVKSSVWICVLIPVLIYILLLVIIIFR